MKRPLSPHLGIYKWHWTMIMSATHRISGILLYGCFPLLPLLLMMFGCGFDVYGVIMESWWRFPVITLLIALSWGLFYHMIGGMRHILLLMGWGHGSWGHGIAIMVFPVSLLATCLFWLGM